MKSEEVNPEFVNPIDEDKIAQNPHSLPYAHTVGSPIIKPIDKGKVKGRAMQAMVEQTGTQMDRIREQIELLASQARDIQRRVEVSTRIYEAAVGFEPLIHQTYHLYERENGEWVLSLVGPNEWGRSRPFPVFISSVRLLADHTWDLLDVNDDAL
ncbi:MAG: DUF2452 domain-containing protein [Bacteroidota bacterium]